MAYYQFKNEDGEEYGSFEVFYHGTSDDEDVEIGWYWWACFPGCLPDGEPTGPFETEEAAKEDALNG